MDEIMLTDAKRTATIATVILSVGWAGVIVSVLYFFLAWIDLTGRETVNFLQAFVYSLGAFATPFFLSLVVAGVGHALRLFALSTITRR